MFSDKSCPYCNKNTETKNLDFFYREESYMEVLKYEHQKNNKDISFEEIVKKNLKLVKCGDCKLTFFKHWFDDETSKKIYISKPHRMGWGSFYLFYNQNNRLEEYIKKKLKIFKSIKNKISKIDTYAEINCPFSGLMLLYNFFGMKKNFKVNILENLSKERKYFPTMLFKILNKFKVILYKYLIFQEIIFNKIIKRKDFKKLISQNNQFNIPNDISLIKLDSNTLSWNYGCNNMENNCRKVFSYFKDFKSVNFEEIEEKNNNLNFKFDLCYLENTLDHTNNLFNILNRIKKISKNIAIITHGKKAGPQHLFYLNEEFIINYSKMNNFKLHILTEEITQKKNNDLDNQYYLLTEVN
tara:strand:- start:1849 stop:2913 length:1065 start_codon:yes stop_codon:yes gene_type:complete